MRAMLLTTSLLVTMAATAFAQTRMPELQPDRMSPEQKTMYDAIMAGPRHSIEGPFNAWMRSPELGNRLQRVGEYLRFNTTIPHNLNEFAILITAVEWKAGFEWYAHYPLAMKAGLEPAVAEDLRQGKRPANMTADEALVYDFATQMQRQKQVSNAVYDSAVKRFGEQGVMDLTGLIGYYNLVSMTLNMAEVHAPAGSKTLEPPAIPVTQ
jgi:4-carboxymuconolactone decarboxylase